MYVLQYQIIYYIHKTNIWQYIYVCSITHHYSMSTKSHQPKALEYAKRSILHCYQNQRYGDAITFIKIASTTGICIHELSSVLSIVELGIKEIERSITCDGSKDDLIRSKILSKFYAMHEDIRGKLHVKRKESKLWVFDISRRFNPCMSACW